MNSYQEQIAANIATARTKIKSALEGAGLNVREGIRDEVLVVDTEAEDQLDIVLKKSDWRLNYMDGVQLTIKAPRSKVSSYGHVAQVRNFRTGKDGSSLNLPGIVAAVEKLAMDMVEADKRRAAQHVNDLDARAAREVSREKLAAAGLLPQPHGEDELDRLCNTEYWAGVRLDGDVEAELVVTHRKGVSIKIEGLTAEQAIALLGRL